MICTYDLATQTGFCRGRGDAPPELGSIRMPDGDEGPFFSFFGRWMAEQVRTACVEADGARVWIGFESPFLPSGRVDPKTKKWKPAPTSIMTLRKLYGLASYTAQICHDANKEYAPGVMCREMAIGSIKKELAGSGRAEKLDMWAACCNMGLEPESNDESDAFGGWLRMMRFYGKQHWPHWQRLLWAAHAGPLEKRMLVA